MPPTTNGSGWLKKEPSMSRRKALDQSTHFGQSGLHPVRAGQSHLRRPKIRKSLALRTSQSGMPVFYDVEEIKKINLGPQITPIDTDKN